MSISKMWPYVGMSLAIIFIFWPAFFGIVDGLLWFFRFDTILYWDGARVVFAFLWVILTFFVAQALTGAI